jgi:hypothetical protein
MKRNSVRTSDDTYLTDLTHLISSMFQANTDPSQNLLTFALSGNITRSETTRWKGELPDQLTGLKSGFKLLSDFSGVESIDVNCAPDIEVVMDLLNRAGVEKVVRVIAHPRQDIGLSIMSLFHYRRCVSIITCQTMEEGLAALAD